MSPILIVIVLFLLGYKFYEFLTCVPPNIPPCIPRLPVGGSYWYLLWGNYSYPHKTVKYYVEKLNSSLVSCYFGGYLAVIANDYSTIKEILKRDEFQGRPTEIGILKERAFGKILGIFFTEGHQWHEQRRFSLRYMRDFGFGRRHDKFESDMMDEVTSLVDMIKGGPINDQEKTFLKKDQAYFPDILFPICANSIWLIMFAEKFSRSEYHTARYLCESAMIFQRAADTTGGAIFQRDFLKYFRNMFGYTNIIKGHFQIVDVVKEHVEKQKQSRENGNNRGLVDKYLEELEKQNPESTFSEEQLYMILIDFMFPTFSAMPSVITHALKFVLHHPEVLKKIQEEIDEVVGFGRHVTWEDRNKLPYTEATIRETLRYETLTPLSVLHKSLKDTTLSGYNIPKNTLVITNLGGLNHDSKVWGDPENFRPERFLNEKGELIKDLSFPFGFGGRICAGETFARYNMFGIFAVLMQNFNFSFVEGEPTGLNDKLPGLIVTPRDTWIRVEPRR